jgi:hypothetical protein
MYAAAATTHDQRIWQTVPESALNPAAKRSIVPEAYRTVRLDTAALAQLLATAPMEFSRNASQNPMIDLPMPDGTLARFRFEESPVMEPSFAAKHPELKTYRAQGIDDPTATARFDWLPSGFHGLILSASGSVLIDPYAEGNTTDYITYWKKDAAKTLPFACEAKGSGLGKSQNEGGFVPAVSSDGMLRTYRLALACTNEFAVLHGHNNTEKTLHVEVALINQVNAVFEREVAIHLEMIDNAEITYAGDNASCTGGFCNAENDPYRNDDCGRMLEENHDNLVAVLGPERYDIGHVLSTCGGGIAGLGTVCGPAKEWGSSGVNHYVFVSHEMGHQFGANHTFNGRGGACSDDTAAPGSAYEPGGGATIMGYVAGTCGAQSLPPPWTDTFHVKSLEEIVEYTHNGDGNTCATLTSTGNAAPSVGGPGNFTIPKQTPFSLAATAFGNSITYDWEEYDLDAGGVGTANVPNSDKDGTPRPIFRTYFPSTSGTRTFPSLQYILDNANVPPFTTTVGTDTFLTGELLPGISRTMVFQVVARGNQAGGGGINTAQSSVTIDGTADPFKVTSPNSGITVSQGTNLNVTWVASGNAANVKISLSTDGGLTFPTVLAASTPNDGAHSVVVPNSPTSLARIKVEAVGNIYFDICDTNFTITGVGGGG